MPLPNTHTIPCETTDKIPAIHEIDTLKLCKTVAFGAFSVGKVVVGDICIIIVVIIDVVLMHVATAWRLVDAFGKDQSSCE